MSKTFLDGLLLAAMTHGDRVGDNAKAGLHPSIHDELRARLRFIQDMSAEKRRLFVRKLTSIIAPPIPFDNLDPRVASWLAASVPRSIGQAWQGLHRVRRGYRPGPRFRDALRRVVMRPPLIRRDTLSADTRADIQRYATLLSDQIGLSATEIAQTMIEGALGQDGPQAAWRRAGAELAALGELS